MRFALIGAAGYVAPRHMKAIKENGGELVALLDPADSVGVIDSYFPNCLYFNELERFWRQLDRWRYENKGIDYLSICSPNYLHDSHCMIGLYTGANVICEKPLVIRSTNFKRLQQVEQSTGKSIYTILQLRLCPNVQKLKKSLDINHKEVYIDYITPRGEWYKRTWKGDSKKSGGILYNIGIHLFDLMYYLFGEYKEGVVNSYTENFESKGVMELERATVHWYLSIDKDKTPIRSIKIDGYELDLSPGFTNLHTESYKEIIDNRGFNTNEVSNTIKFVEALNERGLFRT